MEANLRKVVGDLNKSRGLAVGGGGNSNNKDLVTADGNSNPIAKVTVK